MAVAAEDVEEARRLTEQHVRGNLHRLTASHLELTPKTGDQ